MNVNDSVIGSINGTSIIAAIMVLNIVEYRI